MRFLSKGDLVEFLIYLQMSALWGVFQSPRKKIVLAACCYRNVFFKKKKEILKLRLLFIPMAPGAEALRAASFRQPSVSHGNWQF